MPKHLARQMDEKAKTYTWKPAKEFLLDTDKTELVP
jgi:hypothetical protein